MATFLRTIANCVFDVPNNSSKLSAEEREAARMEAVVQSRTLLRNLQSCGLIEPRAVEKWERQVARDERRRARAERERLEQERGPLPVYSQTAKPAETVLAATA